MAAETYEVTTTWDPEGMWVATVPDVPGCVTQARSLRQLENRLREALSLFVSDAEAANADLEFVIQTKGDLAALLAECDREARELEVHRQRLAGLRAQAIRSANREGVGMRDVGRVLGISHQRVSQLARAGVERTKPSAEASATTRKNNRVQVRVVAVGKAVTIRSAKGRGRSKPNATTRRR